MTARKRYYICGIILIVLFGGLLIWQNITVPLADDPAVTRVLLVEDGTDRDVTDRADLPAMEALLRAAGRGCMGTGGSDHSREDLVLELVGTDGAHEMHVLFGTNADVVYHVGGNWFPIRDAESLLEALLAEIDA